MNCFLIFALLTGSANWWSTSESRMIVGGRDAIPGAWPWQAALTLGGNHHCGAALISDRWLLTAAHCIAEVSHYYDIVLGQYDRMLGGVQTLQLEEVIRHPEYDRDPDKGYPNDIALIKVVSSADEENPLVARIPLADDTFDATMAEECYISGWGRLFAGSHQSYILQDASVEVLNLADCQKRWEPYTILESHLCVYGDGVRGACQGDSGGPLMCRQAGGEWVLVGVTSWGHNMCYTSYPSVHASVSHFRNWINSTTGV